MYRSYFRNGKFTASEFKSSYSSLFSYSLNVLQPSIQNRHGMEAIISVFVV